MHREHASPEVQVFEPGIAHVRVFISESREYVAYFSVSVVYPIDGIFTLSQNLIHGQQAAIAWAETWLAKKYGGSPKLGVPKAVSASD
jgi:hypothetical protein